MILSEILQIVANNIAPQTSFFYLFEDFGECIEHIFRCFDRVVEDNDVATSEVSHHFAGTARRRNAMVVILRDAVPHHHSPPLRAHTLHLTAGHTTIGGAEKACGWKELPCLVGACHIVIDRGEPPSGVVVGVVAYGVTLCHNFLHQFGVEFGIITQTEEGCFGTIVVENVENLLGNFGRRAIVESEIDAPLTIDLPQHCGHHTPYELRKVEIHFLGIYSSLRHKGIKFFVSLHISNAKREFFN